MCIVTYFQHKTCKHIWAVIREPCGPGMGFTTCGTFGSGLVKDAPQYYKTQSRPCPRCQLPMGYDRNAVRMVEGFGYGIKWGRGPDDDDWGCNVKFGSGCIIL